MLKKMGTENDMQYLWRICSEKDSGKLDLSWLEVADLLNHELCDDETEYKGEAAWRKSYQYAKMFYDAGVFSCKNSKDFVDDVNKAKQELYKEKVKLRDERNELSRMLREQARREDYLSLVRETFVKGAEEINPHDFCDYDEGESELVIHLTDVHTGLGINNALNQYNDQILHDRLNQYIHQIQKIAERHKARRCVLVLGGDMISGIIHTSIRLENQVNVITQVKIICNEMVSFIKALRKIFGYVRVASVSGNHSRVSPNKDDHLSGEDFDSLIPFWIKNSFGVDNSVEVLDNTYGDYIAEFEVLKNVFVAVHGDNDSPANVVGNMYHILGYEPDCVMMGHRHNNAMLTEGRVKIVQSGSLCGTDRYAFDKRLTGNAEQCVIVVTYENPVECVYNVEFK